MVKLLKHSSKHPSDLRGRIYEAVANKITDARIQLRKIGISPEMDKIMFDLNMEAPAAAIRELEK